MFCKKGRPLACLFYIEPSWSMILTQKKGDFRQKIQLSTLNYQFSTYKHHVP